jgi:hypothetical protein
MRRDCLSSVRVGATLLDLVLVIICCAVLIALVCVLFLNEMPRDTRLLRDGTQIKQIQEAWIIFAREFNERFPTPASIPLHPVPDQAGEGPNVTLNTTANIHSMCIMQNYYSPEICVSPREPKANVMVCDDYDWETYDPAAGVFWDPQFQADLDDVSHVSYASMPLFGRRYDEQWMESYDNRFATIGTRGPKDGVNDPNSITYEFFGSRNEWCGNVSFTGGNVVFVDSFTPKQAVYVDAEGSEHHDNIFRFDDGRAGGDAILTIVTEMTPTGPIIQHD